MTDSDLINELSSRIARVSGVGRTEIFNAIDSIWAHPEIAPLLQAIRSITKGFDALHEDLLDIKRTLRRIEEKERFTVLMAPIARRNDVAVVVPVKAPSRKLKRDKDGPYKGLT